MLAGPDTAHAAGVDGHILCAGIASRSGKIDENSVGIHRSFNCRIHGEIQSDFNSQVGALLHRRHMLDGYGAGAVLAGSAGPQEQQDRKIFLNSNHSLLTLAGAPTCRLGMGIYCL